MRLLKYIKVIDPSNNSEELSNILECIEKIKSDLSDIKLLHDDRLTLSFFLYLYPLKNEKVFKKLDGKKKIGYISRHLMSVGNKKGLNDLVDQYVDIKNKAKSAGYYKNSDYWKRSGEDSKSKLYNFVNEEKYKKELQIRRRDLKEITILIAEKLIFKYNKRLEKINEILES